MTENVLVTGGLGFVGSRVVRQLIERGHDPYAFDRATETDRLERLGVAGETTLLRGDVSEPTDVIRAVARNDVTRVVHLAALLTTDAVEPRAVTDVNVVGTNNVLEAARAIDGVERVVYASSETVYAPASAYGDDPVGESAPVSPGTLYAGSKLYAERQAAAYRERFDVSAAGLRPTLIYGPYAGHGDASFVARLIEGAARGEAVTVDNGDQVVSWLHVEDAARAFVEAALADDAALSEPVYNVRGELATVREAAAVVAERCPDAAITVEDGSEEWSSQRLDLAAARRDLGFEPEYDLEAGIENYLAAVA